ncbi:hypothetical protein GW17_00047818 [Ensete ventricosum]|nr:hypothetical protein GW17_00047818 [Ensete ventricosum]RZR75714.1 hypothetical protein BHM03_00000194 [Ensete ventricosum]
MAGQAYFIAAMAVCFSMAPAVATTPGYNPCSFAELPIQYCKSFLQTGSHCSKPSLACCALVSDVFMVNPSCLCEAIKPSFLGVAVDPARVSLLPELCHLPTKNLHCFGTSFAGGSVFYSNRSSARSIPTVEFHLIATVESTISFN